MLYTCMPRRAKLCLCLAWHRFLLTWLLFLPFAIYKTFQWFTPGVCAVVAFLLLGVEVHGPFLP